MGGKRAEGCGGGGRRSRTGDGISFLCGGGSGGSSGGGCASGSSDGGGEADVEADGLAGGRTDDIEG